MEKNEKENEGKIKEKKKNGKIVKKSRIKKRDEERFRTVYGGQGWK